MSDLRTENTHAISHWLKIQSDEAIRRAIETSATPHDDIDVEVLFDAAIEDPGDQFHVPHLTELRGELETDAAYVRTVALEKAQLWLRIAAIAHRESLSQEQTRVLAKARGESK